MTGKRVALLLLGVASVAGAVQQNKNLVPPKPTVTQQPNRNLLTDRGKNPNKAKGPDQTPTAGPANRINGAQNLDGTKPGKEETSPTSPHVAPKPNEEQAERGFLGGVKQQPRTEVPNVVGMTVAQAKADLQGKQLQGACRDSSGDEVKNQDPMAGTMVPKFSAVRLICTTAATTDVPSVVNMATEVAAAVLEKSRLHLVQQPDSAGANTIPIIFSQSPLAGKTVDLNTAVNVWLKPQAAPPEPVAGQPVPPQPPPERPTVVVPDVKGKSPFDASRILKAFDLVPQDQIGSSKSSRTGTVISENPDAGATVSSGSVVTLAFKVGQVQVPDLLGLPSDQAKKELDSLELNEEVTPDSQDATQSDRLLVTAQSPKAGSMVDALSEVNVTFGSQGLLASLGLPTLGTSRAVVLGAGALGLLGVGLFVRAGKSRWPTRVDIVKQQLRTLTPPTVIFRAKLKLDAGHGSRYSGKPAQIEFVLRLEAVPKIGHYTIKREPAVLERRKVR